MAKLIQRRFVRNRLSSANGVRLHSFCIVRPPHSGTQEEALHWLAEAHSRAEETYRLNNGHPPVESQFCGHDAQAAAPLWLFAREDLRAAQPGQLVASLAFGPGLTICGGLFQVEQ